MAQHQWHHRSSEPSNAGNLPIRRHTGQWKHGRLIDTHGLLQFGQKLRVGDRVRVTAGPFAERFAICERLNDSGRVRVLLDIMGGQVPVSVDRDYLSAAE